MQQSENNTMLAVLMKIFIFCKKCNVNNGDCV